LIYTETLGQLDKFMPVMRPRPQNKSEVRMKHCVTPSRVPGPVVVIEENHRAEEKGNERA
jgi:hypothetical protein